VFRRVLYRSLKLYLLKMVHMVVVKNSVYI